MSIPKPVVDEVRARTDIVEVIGRTVTLRRRGTSYVGLCPFHQEKTPSFHVVPNKAIYHCFGCGEGGDVITFVRKTRGLSFVEAVKELAGPVGITIEERPLSVDEQRRIGRRADLHETVELACRYFEATLLTRPEGAAGRAYLETRGVPLEVARKYRLGFAPDGWQNLVDHLGQARIPTKLLLDAGLAKLSEKTGRLYDVFRQRLIFPILDDRGRPVAFGGRILPGTDTKDAPKYLNSPGSEIYDKSHVLYGLSWARNSIQRKDRVIVVEGYFDALSLWQAGFEEAVAPCGTALTPTHVEALRRLAGRVIALFDTDEAGLNAAGRALPLFLDARLDARRLDLPGAKDPDEYVKKFGAAAFEERLSHTEPVLDLVIRREIDRAGRGAEGRTRALGAVIPLLRKLEGPLRTETVQRVSGWLGLHESELVSRLGAEVAPAPATPPPTRWAPSRELAQLLYLLLHAPTVVGPLLVEVEPAVISDRPAVLRTLARVLAGTPPAALIDEANADDPDLARVLTSLSAREDPAVIARADATARGILARMEVVQVDQDLNGVQREIARCEATGDKSSYALHARRLAELYARKASLTRRISRRDPKA